MSNASLAARDGKRVPEEHRGHIIHATIMAATASIDHRVIDAAIAAEFMAAVRNLAEVPM